MGCPYDQPQHRLHHTPLGLRVLIAVFFYHPVTKLGGHLLNVTTIDIQLLCDLLIGKVQSHEVQTQYPDFEGLVVSCKDGFSEIIESLPARFALIALPIGLCIIEASFDDLAGITKWSMYFLRPAKFPYGIKIASSYIA